MRDARAACLHGEAGDGAEGVGAHGGLHELARLHGGAGREADEQLGRVGGTVGHHAQHEAPGAAVLAVVDRGEYGEVAHLTGARRPVQAAAGRVVNRAFGQAAEADGQGCGLRRTVGIGQADRTDRGQPALDHRQTEALADQQGVACRVDLGRPVAVEHAHLHRAGDGGCAIAGAEVEGEGAAVSAGVVDHLGIRRPLKIAGGGVEADAGGRISVIEQGQTGGVVVAVGGADLEAQGLALGHKLKRQGQQDGGLVDVGDLNLKLAAEAGAAVAGAEREQVVTVVQVAALRREQAWRPAQLQSGLAAAAAAGGHLHPCRHAFEAPVQCIEVAVERGQVHRQGRAFIDLDDATATGQGIALHHPAGGRDGEQGGRGIGGAHDDAQVAHGDVAHRGLVGIDDVARVGRGQA